MKNTAHIKANELKKLFSEYRKEEHKKTQRHKNYLKGKAQAIDKAIEYQHNASEKQYSYSELYEISNYFYKLAKRYGLIKEFRENGII